MTLASNQVIVAPGRSESLLRFKCDRGFEHGLTAFVTCTLVNEAPPTVFTNRDPKLEVRFQGQMGGGTVIIDSARGCAFAVGGCTLDLRAINESDGVTAEEQTINIYRYEVSVVPGFVGHIAPRFSQRVQPGAVASTGYLRIPEYARELQVFAFPEPVIGPPPDTIRFYQHQLPAGNIPLFQTTYYNDVGIRTPTIPVPSGAEWLQLDNQDLHNTRQYLLVWTINL